MNTYDEREMQTYLAEQVSQIMNEQRPLLATAGSVMIFSALLAGLLTLVLIRAFAVNDTAPARDLPAASWTSPAPTSVPAVPAETAAPTPEPEPEPATIEVSSRYAPVTDEEIELMARIVHLESNNQTFEGQQAVAEVILNRIWAQNFPDTAQEVVYSAGQFTTAKGAAAAVPTLENYMAVMAALYAEPVTPLDVVYFNGEAESQYVWKQLDDHVFCYQYPWAYETGQYNNTNREARTVAFTIYRWTVTHPKHGSIEVTAINRWFAVKAAAQDWGLSEKLSLFAECDVERGEAVMSDSPELDEEDNANG